MITKERKTEIYKKFVDFYTSLTHEEYETFKRGINSLKAMIEKSISEDNN